MVDWNEIAARIAETTGERLANPEAANRGGGCINRAVELRASGRSYFIKLNAASLLDMFEAEAAGLEALAATGTIRVPSPICWGTSGGEAYLVLEQLDLNGSGDTERAGRQLAALHRHTRDRFGWERDNTIGSTPQPNTQHHDWVAFWREQRLGFQLELAAKNGHRGALQRKGEQLFDVLPALLDHAPAPALLHGDIWGGNIAYLRDGSPVIFDPATYYGDREADLAMTELFGGFGGRFYDAYNEAWPLDSGYRTRKTLYNLYHILNHLNLFGGGYGGQALGMTERLLAEVR